MAPIHVNLYGLVAYIALTLANLHGLVTSMARNCAPVRAPAPAHDYIIQRIRPGACESKGLVPGPGVSPHSTCTRHFPNHRYSWVRSSLAGWARSVPNLPGSFRPNNVDDSESDICMYYEDWGGYLFRSRFGSCCSLGFLPHSPSQSSGFPAAPQCSGTMLLEPVFIWLFVATMLAVYRRLLKPIILWLYHMIHMAVVDLWYAEVADERAPPPLPPPVADLAKVLHPDCDGLDVFVHECPHAHITRLGSTRTTIQIRCRDCGVVTFRAPRWGPIGHVLEVD